MPDLRYTWEERLADFVAFSRRYGRHPSRHWAMTPDESSLAWWVKDQRRKLRQFPADDPKHGRLTPEQAAKLREAGIEPRVITGRIVRVEGGPAKGAGTGMARGLEWRTRLEELRLFLRKNGRPPLGEYTASPAEVQLARWVMKVDKLLKRKRARQLKLSRAERRILGDAGVHRAFE